MKARSQLPDFVEQIIRKSGVRRLRNMEMFHVHLLSECLSSQGIECRALARSAVLDPVPYLDDDTQPHEFFYAIELEGQPYSLRGVKGWDQMAQARMVGSRRRPGFEPKWDAPAAPYERGTLFGQGEPQLRAAVKEGVSQFQADTLADRLMERAVPSPSPRRRF